MSASRTKFYLDKQNKKFKGVCAGIADYTGVDVTIVRIGLVILTCVGGIPWTIIAYMIAATILFRSEFGLASLAVRENNLRVEYLGISANRVVTINFIIAAIFAAIASSASTPGRSCPSIVDTPPGSSPVSPSASRSARVNAVPRFSIGDESTALPRSRILATVPVWSSSNGRSGIASPRVGANVRVPTSNT